MTATLGEVILLAASKTGDDEKIKVFQDHLRSYGQDPSLKNALQILLDPKYKLDLPKGTPPHRNENIPDGLGDSNLRMEMRRMYLFLKDGVVTDSKRKEVLFIQLLEGLASADHDLLLAMKDQNLNGLTADLVNRVFPGLIPVAASTIKVEPVAPSVQVTATDAIEPPKTVKPKRSRKKPPEPV